MPCQNYVKITIYSILSAIGLSVLGASMASAATPGAPLTSLISVLSSSSGNFNPGDASIARDSAGNFIVVWKSEAGAQAFLLYARRFSATGSPLGEQFLVDSARVEPYAGMDTPIPVAMDANGDFVVAFASKQIPEGYTPPNNTDFVVYIYAKVFNRDGTPRGDKIFVGRSPTYGRITSFASAEAPAVAIDTAGNFVVAWKSSKTFGQKEPPYLGVGQGTINARRYDSAGQPQSDVVTVATGSFPPGVQVVMSATGDYAIGYETPNNQLLSPYRARIYHSNGNAYGAADDSELGWRSTAVRQTIGDGPYICGKWRFAVCLGGAEQGEESDTREALLEAFFAKR